MEQGELLEYAVNTLERLGVTYMIVGSFTRAPTANRTSAWEAVLARLGK